MGPSRLSRGDLTDQLRLKFSAFSLTVHCNDARLAARLRSYFRDFVVAPSKRPAARSFVLEARAGEPPPVRARLVSWDTRGKESYGDVGARRIIRKDRTGVVIELRPARWTVTGDLLRNFSQLVNVVCSMYGCALMDAGGAMLHASAAVRNGRAIAFIGQSGTGKSSVAVRLLERGFDFLANDRLVVMPSKGVAQAMGLPKLPRVNPGTLLAGRLTEHLVDERARRRYRKLGRQRLWELEDKYDLDFEEALGRRWVLSAPLRAGLVLNWRRGGGELRLERLRPEQAIEALRLTAKSFGPFDLKLLGRNQAALRSVAQAVPFFRVTGEIDPTALAERIAKRPPRA